MSGALQFRKGLLCARQISGLKSLTEGIEVLLTLANLE
jgi:hypothetical protein